MADMTNVIMEVKDNILTIKVNLDERHGKSSSGKTTIVASSRGNVEVPEVKGIFVGLNVYTK